MTTVVAASARSNGDGRRHEGELNRAFVLDYPIAAASAEACIDHVRSWRHRHDRTRYLVCLNPHSAFVASRDAEFHDAIMAADLVIPDGIGIIWASRVLRAEIRSRVTGSDIFWGLSTLLQQNHSGRYFFLGSNASTLEAIKCEMARQFPSIEVAGTHAPPFTDGFTPEESARMVEMINAAQPDVLWVGLSAPKQEKWIFRNRREMRVPVAVPVGAVFDYFARTKHRPGYLARKLGLEWLVRLSREPQRLWRRSCLSAPAFAAQVAASRIRSRSARQ